MEVLFFFFVFKYTLPYHCRSVVFFFSTLKWLKSCGFGNERLLEEKTRIRNAAVFMASVFQLRRRFFCTSSSKWRVKQVTTSNFEESLQELKTHISSSDYVAVSMAKTGSPSPPSWLRPLPFDTAQTAYSKARRAAHRFQLLHFAVCPFSVSSSDKLLAHPSVPDTFTSFSFLENTMSRFVLKIPLKICSYNFVLFPRDELKMGMPSYSFSCQTSLLASMARRGFDFNACVYNGELLLLLCVLVLVLVLGVQSG